jgi:hypothetical protein
MSISLGFSRDLARNQPAQLPQKFALGRASSGALRYRSSDCGAGDGSFAQRRGASSTKKFVQLSGRENKQQTFPDRLGRFALWTVKFTGCEFTELLRHTF